MTIFEIVVAFTFFVSGSISFAIGVLVNFPSPIHFKTELGETIYLIILSVFTVVFIVSLIMCCIFSF